MSKRINKNFGRIFLGLAIIALPFSALASQAGLVVKKQNGATKTACVEFAGDSISGMKLLQTSGFDVVVKNGFVVSIDGEGAKDNSQMSGGDPFWSYWKLNGNSWVFQNVGANYSKVKDGGVEGWEFGYGQSSLPQMTFEQICKPESVKVNSDFINVQATALEDNQLMDQREDQQATKSESFKGPEDNPTQIVEQSQTTTPSFSNDRESDSAVDNKKRIIPDFNFINVLILFMVFIFAGMLFVFARLLFRKFSKSCRKR